MSKSNVIEKYLQTLINEIREKNINKSTLLAYTDFLNKNDTDLIIEYIRKTGFFRPSKYNFDTTFISQFFSKIQKHDNFKKFSEYFSSIENLFYISKKVKNYYNNIKIFILSEKNLIKYFFAKSDNIFTTIRITMKLNLLLNVFHF